MAITDYEIAKENVKLGIDFMADIPLHQGTCDVTEIIDFQTISKNANLSPTQYDKLIDYGQKYLDNRIHNQYYK